VIPASVENGQMQFDQLQRRRFIALWGNGSIAVSRAGAIEGWILIRAKQWVIAGLS
jgi:hypothetical protein